MLYLFVMKNIFHKNLFSPIILIFVAFMCNGSDRIPMGRMKKATLATEGKGNYNYERNNHRNRPNMNNPTSIFESKEQNYEKEDVEYTKSLPPALDHIFLRNPYCIENVRDGQYYTFSKKIKICKRLKAKKNNQNSLLIKFKETDNILHLSLNEKNETLKINACRYIKAKKSNLQSEESFCWIEQKNNKETFVKLHDKVNYTPPFFLLPNTLQKQMLNYLNIPIKKNIGKVVNIKTAKVAYQKKGMFPFDRKKIRNMCWKILFNSFFVQTISFIFFVTCRCYPFNKKNISLHRNEALRDFLLTYSVYNINGKFLKGYFPFITTISACYALTKV